MKYRGFEITSCYDSGCAIPVIDPNNKYGQMDIPSEGYYCQVYPEWDDDYAYELDSFLLIVGWNLNSLKDEDLEAAIKEYIDEDFYSLSLLKQEKLQEVQ